jgi:two-component system, sensor histidine kinase and response regulator
MASKSSRILIVDDLAENIALMETILQLEGYEIDVASSGLEAIERVRHQRPDLVLLDVMMPGMSGIETTRRLKAQSDLGYICVLLITASDKASLVEGMNAGADDFLRKPLDYGELMARVRSLLRLKHTLDERDYIARQRENFVSHLTHDLRTPLVSADRMLELIIDEDLGLIPLGVKEALITMRRSNQHLLGMTNNLLEVYRYDAGAKTIHCESFDGNAFFVEISQELRPLATDKGIALHLSVPDTLDIFADKVELRRVLHNLLGNALKFSDLDGEVCLEVASDGKLLQFSVSDQGPGISEEDKLCLFERFHQGKHFRGGTGLGLHHCRQIVEAHGGKISVASTVGAGSTFTVFLPIPNTNKSLTVFGESVISTNPSKLSSEEAVT